MTIAIRVVLAGVDTAVGFGTTAGALFGEDRSVVAARVGGELRDLSHPLADGDVVDPVRADSEDGRAILRHSTAHVLAEQRARRRPESHGGVDTGEDDADRDGHGRLQSVGCRSATPGGVAEPVDVTTTRPPTRIGYAVESRCHHRLVSRLRTLVMVVAHPDDDAYGIASTVALHADDPEFRFVLVHATDGEGGDIALGFPATRETLGSIRRAEDEAAWRAVGREPDRHEWLGLPDGELADLPSTSSWTGSQRSSTTRTRAW